MRFSTLFGVLALASSSLASTLPRAAGNAKQVFAHYMLGDIPASQWAKDISDAKSAGIDGFALNTGPQPSYIDSAFSAAYKAAAAADFKVFISFDMAAGSWTPDQVIKYINEFKASPAQLKVGGKPFVSTFEGPDWSANWAAVKSAVGGIYLVPAWTSLGAQGLKAKLDVVDGAFNWDAWPEVGESKKDTQGDVALQGVLGSKAYMMGVSPYFYTDLPQYSKNWYMGSDSLWFDRWNQVLDLQPDFIEIITWNDYGESHYIADTYTPQIVSGADAYVNGFPHEAFRFILPSYIAAYKAGAKAPTVTTEGALFWYRSTTAGICGDGGTTCGSNGPSATQCTKDVVSVLVASKKATTVTVKIGGNGKDFKVAAGMQLVQLPFDKSMTGKVTVTMNGKTGTGATLISAICPLSGHVNFNAVVGQLQV